MVWAIHRMIIMYPSIWLLINNLRVDSSVARLGDLVVGRIVATTCGRIDFYPSKVIVNHPSGVSGKGFSLHLGRKLVEMEGLRVLLTGVRDIDLACVRRTDVNSGKTDTKLQYHQVAYPLRHQDLISPR